MGEQEKGEECHRKLRGRDITLDLTGKVLQRSYKGDLLLPTSRPGKKTGQSSNIITLVSAITSPGMLPRGYPAKGPGSAGPTGVQRQEGDPPRQTHLSSS